jgi:predicted NUDIX family phosphoesterase
MKGTLSELHRRANDVQRKGMTNNFIHFLIDSLWREPDPVVVTISDETNLKDFKLTSKNIDARLNYLASIGTTGKVIDIQGNSPRTSASEAAFITLTTTLQNYVVEDPEMISSETNLKDLRLTSANIDARLNYLASIGTTGKVIDIQGNSRRTSASEAAFTTLTTTLQNYVVEDPEM